MIKNPNFSPQLNKKQHNQSQMAFNQSEILQIQHLDLNFMNGSASKSNDKKNQSLVTKIKPNTQRISNNNSLKRSSTKNIDNQVTQALQCAHFDQSNNKTDRETLLQKRKSYAQSIRQKNKQILNQQNTNEKSRNKLSKFQSINLSSSHHEIFTPPKDVKNKQNVSVSSYFVDIQKQYYSSTKKFQSSAVFKQTNQNQILSNSMSNNDVNAGLKSTRNNNVSSKIKNVMNMNNTIDLNNCYEINSGRNNHESSTRKSQSIKNKENKLVIPSNPPPLSGNKKSSIKYGSYAQIFDKKSTINALLNHQKNGNSSVGLTGSVRRMNSMSNKKQSLKSMNLQESNFQFGSHQISKNIELENFMTENPNNYVVQQFAQSLEQISQICESNKDQNQNQIKEQPKVKNLILNSNLYTETVDFTQHYRKIRLEQEKQIIILAKQNGTFKKQLATFRKENSTLRKQLQNCKKYIKELEQKAQKLLQEQQLSKSMVHQNFINLTQTPFLSKDLSQSTCSNFIYHPEPSPSTPSNNLQQILQNSQQQLFSLKSQNKALQLKVYMLQKKLVHEQQLSKKRLALQVNNWKQKYNKLRNQHLRTKNNFLSNYALNSDWSISMDISRDQ